MKYKVFSIRGEQVRIGYSSEPLRDYGPAIKASFELSGKPKGISVPHSSKEELNCIVDAILLFGQAENMGEFLAKLERHGYHDQIKDPFRTEWELERTLEKAESLKRRLECGLNSGT